MADCDRPLVSRQATAQRRGHLRPRYANPSHRSTRPPGSAKIYLWLTPHLRRIGGISESATLAVDAKAKALKAAGRPVIGFGAGEPDFATPGTSCRRPNSLATTRHAPLHPAGGLPALREAIAAKTARDSGFEVTAGQVLVTNGGKQALYNTFAALLDPGDEALLPAPYWTTYPESIQLAGAYRW